MFTILIVEDSKEILDLMVLHLEDKYNLTYCATSNRLCENL